MWQFERRQSTEKGRRERATTTPKFQLLPRSSASSAAAVLLCLGSLFLWGRAVTAAAVCLRLGVRAVPPQGAEDGEQRALPGSILGHLTLSRPLLLRLRPLFLASFRPVARQPHRARR